jgi:hypothetical protein
MTGHGSDGSAVPSRAMSRCTDPGRQKLSLVAITAFKDFVVSSAPELPTREDLLPSGRDARGRMTTLPPALRQRCWAPGQSGNPSGKGSVYHEMQRLAREFSPEAVAYLIEIARDGT